MDPGRKSPAARSCQTLLKLSTRLNGSSPTSGMTAQLDYIEGGKVGIKVRTERGMREGGRKTERGKKGGSEKEKVGRVKQRGEREEQKKERRF